MNDVYDVVEKLKLKVSTAVNAVVTMVATGPICQVLS